MPNYDFNNYYDGVPEEISNMTPEELEKAIEEEEKKVSQMTTW